MKEPMIFAYMLQLSGHMWEDEHSPKRGWYMKPPYTENNNVDLALWDDTVKFLGERKYNLVLVDVGDGMQYESHPEISAPDAWDKDFLKKKLAEMRSLGMEPIPKLNFSACHDTWMKEYRRMLSTPTYYAVCADIIKEVCEVFDYPRFFHLGLDEEGVDLQRHLEAIMVRGNELWWRDAYFLFKECEKHGARPWVWSDYMWGQRELFLKNMPKSVLQSNWFYHIFKDYSEASYSQTAIHSYEILDEKGYDQIPTSSSWGMPESSFQTLAFGKERLDPAHLLGYMTVPWRNTETDYRYDLFCDADHLYTARKEIYPETL